MDEVEEENQNTNSKLFILNVPYSTVPLSSDFARVLDLEPPDDADPRSLVINGRTVLDRFICCPQHE